MKLIRSVVVVLPIAIALAGCERGQSNRVASPEPSPEPTVLEARWATGLELEKAIQFAGGSPLVRRAIEESQNPRLTGMWRYAVRAVGRLTDGTDVGVTILPYMVDGDSTHAMFISYIDGDGRQFAEPSELIVGREPTSLETGFRRITLPGDRIGWIKTGTTYKQGSGGIVRMAGARRNWLKFAECFFDRAPSYCAAGAEIARHVAGGVPYASAAGCGVGVAVAAAVCAATFLG